MRRHPHTIARGAPVPILTSEGERVGQAFGTDYQPREGHAHLDTDEQGHDVLRLDAAATAAHHRDRVASALERAEAARLELQAIEERKHALELAEAARVQREADLIEARAAALKGAADRAEQEADDLEKRLEEARAADTATRESRLVKVRAAEELAAQEPEPAPPAGRTIGACPLARVACHQWTGSECAQGENCAYLQTQRAARTRRAEPTGRTRRVR